MWWWAALRGCSTRRCEIAGASRTKRPRSLNPGRHVTKPNGPALRHGILSPQSGYAAQSLNVVAKAPTGGGGSNSASLNLALLRYPIHRRSLRTEAA